MKISWLFLFLFVGLSSFTEVSAQTRVRRGKIITPATTSVMDPNQDGYVTKSRSGFSNDGSYVGEFELPMFGIPKLGGDVTGDNIGEKCGITDLIPDRDGHSVYALRDANNNLIFRFRVGKNNSSVEAWTILLDTDGRFGTNDPNSTISNPGFEIDITLIKNQNEGVSVFNIDGQDKCGKALKTYALCDNFQISIADEVSCGDLDYFYDFYIPFNEIAPLFNINVNTGLRYVAVVNNSATCAVDGNVADISGVDNNDPGYEKCVTCAYTDIIESQCPTPVVNLCATCVGFNPSLPAKPTLNEPIRAGQAYVSGKSKTGTFIKLSIYARTGGTDAQPVWSSTPREELVISVLSSFWSVTLNGPILSYDRIVARAQLNATGNDCGASSNNTSSTSYTMASPNKPPVAQDQVVNVIEDTPKNIVLVSSDPDGDPIDFCTIVTVPQHGVLTGTAPNLVYTPNLNYAGPDSFSFKVCDGILYSNIATVTINVQPVNDIPVASNSSVTVIEDTPTSFTLIGSDVDGDVLIYTMVSQPSHGTLSGSGANLIYTPDVNYTGSDSFTFKVNDGTVDSNTATVSITCTPVNDAPIASDQSITVNEDASVALVLGVTDAEANTLTYTIVTPPKHGTLTGTGANLIYTPDLNYFGLDSFTFKANDGTSDSNIATVSITVISVNDAPIANNQNIIVFEDAPTSVTLTGSDVDGDVLVYTVVTQPLHGTLSGTGANLTYTPNTNFTGSDSFSFKVNDGTVDSNIATVSISVVRFSDPPIANSQSVITDEDVSLPIILTGNDPDGDAITFIVVSGPTHGKLSGTGAILTYTPDPNYYGSDSFTFKVNDGTFDSNIATVSFTINPINDAPVAFNLMVPYQLNTPKSFTIRGTDIESGNLTASTDFILLTQPSNGTLSGTAPNLIYNPSLNFSGSDTFTFKVTDGSLESEVATVTFVLDNLVNDAPMAADQSVIVIEDQSKNITLQATDADADPITFTIVTLPLHGKLSGLAPNVVYTPDANYTGPDSFTFSASDGTLNSVATISITVIPFNDAPIAANQTVIVQEDIAKDITLAYVDAEVEIVTFTILTQPTHGVLSGTAPNLTYTPNPNYTGPDSFTFRVNDGNANSNIATVSINVVPANDAPVALDDAIVTNEDVAVTFSVISNDSDSDGTINPSSIDLNPATPAADKTFTIAGVGTFTANNSGNVTFTPELNYNGVTVPILYTIKDNSGATSITASIQVTVIPVNDAPVVQDKTVTINEDEITSICFTVTDVENDPSVFIGGVSLNGNGTLVLDPATGQYCFRYTPKKDYNGQDKVEVTVCDANNTGLCSKGIITININPVNDPPIGLFNGVPGNVLTLSTPEDTPLAFCFNVTDKEGNTISVSNINEVDPGGKMVSGTTVANQLCFMFTPNADFNGKAVWEVNICDDGIPSACGKLIVEINVTPVNDAPVARNQTVTVLEDTPKVITPDATDVDGDVLTFTIIANPVHGTLTLAGNVITYTPVLGYNGPDSFTYKANDGMVDSNVATVSITVTPVNDAPVISAIPTLSTPEDTEVQICLGVSDTDSDMITYQSPVNISGGGTMPPSNSFDFCYVFMPAKDFNGDAFWKFTVCDNGNPSKCTEVIVKITVTPVNDAPIAVNDFITAQSYTTSIPVNILVNDRDVENDRLVLTVTPMAGPFHGTVTMNADGSFEYKSNMDYVGADSVRYRVCDTGTPSLCDEGVVFIDVGPAPFKIYNGLSPNGDNRNDYWRIDGIEAYPNNHIRLFDRYNNMIFETKGYNNDDNSWRGQTNHSLISGNVPEGTYFYSVDLGDGSGLYSGYIVLKKN